MFSTNHFVWIGVCAGFIGILTFISLKFKFSFRTSAFIMAGISLVSEISKIISDMEFVNGTDVADGMIIDPKSLPFHLCSLMIFAFFYLPFCKSEKVKAFITSLAVPVSLIGGTLAILMATSGTEFNTADTYQCFIYHAGMIWFAIYLIATKQVDLGAKAWLRNLVTVFCLAVAMIWVNSILSAYNTNFFYVVRPPLENLPILNLDHGWYAYFGTLIVCGLVGLTAVHLPFVILELKSKKSEIVKF